MTGLERLRELSGELHSALLREIADQIEREQAQTVEDHEKQQQIIRDLQRERDEALRAASASRRVAAELRTLAGEWDEYGLGGKLMELAERLEAHEAAEAHATGDESKTYTSDELDERKASCGDHASETDATFEGEKVTRDASIAIPVLAVVEEMERHCLGVEWMQDSPVARWARELREVVGWPVRGEDDVRAAKWVREHGGIEAVSSVFDRHLLAIKRLYRTAFPGEGKNYEFPTVDDCFAELDRRLMPPGMEWPRFEDGEKVHFMNACISDNGEEFHAKFIGFGANLETFIGDRQSLVCAEKWNCIRQGERVKRPAPAVLAADGEPLEVGQTVWGTDAEADTPLTVVEVSSDLVRCEYTWKDGKTYRPCYQPDQLTHQRPVLDADGVPIREGDSVWIAENGHGPRIVKEMYGPSCVHLLGISASYRADQLTHTKPEPSDSWEKWRRDMLRPLTRYVENVMGEDITAFEYVDLADMATRHMERRAKALAERERGE